MLFRPIKAKIDDVPQNSKCKLYRDKDEIVNYIINKCSKLAQKKFKTRHDWVGKVIDQELCKRLKFDPTTKRYMHKTESVLENETHKTCWDLEIQTDHLIHKQIPQFQPEVQTPCELTM